MIDEGYSIDLVLIAGIWVLYSIVKIIFFIFKVFSNVKNSKNYFQFKIPFQLVVNDIDKAEVVKISEDSLIFKVNMSNHLIKNINEFNNVLLCLPSTPIKFNIEITSTSINKRSHIAIIKAKILWSSESDRELLNNCIYSVNWHRSLFNQDTNSSFSTLSGFLYRLFTFKLFRATKFEQWEAVNYKVTSNKVENIKIAFISKVNNEFGIGSFVTFEKLKIDEEISFNSSMALAQKQSFNNIELLKEETLALSNRMCLDKSVMRRYTVRYK